MKSKNEKAQNGPLTKKQFGLLIRKLEVGLRIKNENALDQEQFDMYYKFLKGISYENLLKAVDKIIKTNDICFFPTIAKIRDFAGANVPPPPKALTKKDIENMYI